MKHFISLTMAMAFASLLFCMDVRGQEGVFSSDGSILNEDFKKDYPATWSFSTQGGNRKEVSVQNGELSFANVKGDNNINVDATVDVSQPFAIEVAFSIPETIQNQYAILTLERANGVFKVMMNQTGDATRVLLGNKNLGTVKTGQAYTVAVLCEPDGTYKGVLTGPTIENPKVVSYTDADGEISHITLGNNFGAGEGALLIDSVKIGKPVK